MSENVLKSFIPRFWACVARTKGKCCERRRRSRAQCLSACTGVVDLVIKSMELKQMLYPEMGYLLELQIVGKISVRISMLCCSLQNP